MRDHPNVMLNIVDSNFGMTERDVEIAEFIQRLQDEYGWPERILVDGGFSDIDRSLRIVEIMRRRMHVGCSLQSLNPETLACIGRRNPPWDVFVALQQELKRHGITGSTELIMPLPEETRDSFIMAMCRIIDAGVPQITPFTFMMLKGTRLGTAESRRKYGLGTFFRLMPMQFGDYPGGKVFETEEVCVETSTFKFDDYLACRAFCLIAKVYSHCQFDPLMALTAALGIARSRLMIALMEFHEKDTSAFGAAIRSFIDETRRELWPDKADLEAHFAEPEEYAQLLSGRRGDNLMSRYLMKILIDDYDSFIAAGTSRLKMLANAAVDRGTLEKMLPEFQRWLNLRHGLGDLFHRPDEACRDITLHFAFDFERWYRADEDGGAPWNHAVPTVYRFHRDSHEMETIFDENARLFGADRLMGMRRFVEGQLTVPRLRRRCEPLA